MTQSDSPKIKTTFFLPVDLHQRLRVQAALERTSMVELFTRALDQMLTTPPPSPDRTGANERVQEP